MKIRPINRRKGILMELNRSDEPLIEAAESAASPFRIKKIVVPIDFSDCANKALRYAIPFAKQHGAVLTLLHVVSPDFVTGEALRLEFTDLLTDLQRIGARRLSALAANEIGSAVSNRRVVRVGHVAGEIVDLANELPADLIIMSTHGRSGLKHMLLGSVTERVVRTAPCPVLVVREREHEFLQSEAIAACEGSPVGARTPELARS